MTKTAMFEKRLAKFNANQERERALKQAKSRKRRNALARKRYRAQRRREIPLMLEMIKHSRRMAVQTRADTGAVTNDVGNTVIMPKEGESFDDTMRRADGYGKTVTPSQIKAEMATAPKRVAQTLVAAPLVGVGGAAALAAPGELAGGAEKLLQISESALEHLAENYPQLTKLATTLGYGVGAAGGYKLLSKLGVH